MTEEEKDQLAVEEARKIVEYAQKYKISDMMVSEFMTKGILKIRKETPIKSTIKAFKEHKISGAPVIDGQDRMVGIVTGYDLLLQAATRDLNEYIHYKKNVTTVQMNQTLADVIKLLYKTKFHRVPVLNSLGHVVGIVSQHDILYKLLSLESVEH